MSSTVVPVASFDLKMLRTFYLMVDMEFDNRKNAAHAILNKLSRDLLEISIKFGGSLAVPQPDLCSIMLIIEPEKMNNELLVDFFKDQRISIKLDCECDLMAIESSLPFAVFYFMERVSWRRIGECFVQEGFLTWNQTNFPRIQIQIRCSDFGEIYIKFTAEIVRIRPFEQFILDRDERFSDSSSGSDTKEIRPRWVSCLPNLGKGKIVKIHRKIPEDAPFDNYNQMKSYWKKTYGYDLPSSEPEVYYDVLFYNEQCLLYPFYCVLTGAPDVLPLRHNSTVAKDALGLFMKSFKEASISIFGHPLNTDDKESPSKIARDAMMKFKVSRTPDEEKVFRTHPEARKIYPKIPLKRKVSSDGSNITPIKKRRPGLGIPVE